MIVFLFYRIWRVPAGPVRGTGDDLDLEEWVGVPVTQCAHGRRARYGHKQRREGGYV